MNACGRSNCAVILSIFTVFGVTNVRYGIESEISELLTLNLLAPTTVGARINP